MINHFENFVRVVDCVNYLKLKNVVCVSSVSHHFFRLRGDQQEERLNQESNWFERTERIKSFLGEINGKSKSLITEKVGLERIFFAQFLIKKEYCSEKEKLFNKILHMIIIDISSNERKYDL